jgi:hypothetical protein
MSTQTTIRELSAVGGETFYDGYGDLKLNSLRHFKRTVQSDTLAGTSCGKSSGWRVAPACILMPSEADTHPDSAYLVALAEAQGEP